MAPRQRGRKCKCQEIMLALQKDCLMGADRTLWQHFQAGLAESSTVSGRNVQTTSRDNPDTPVHECLFRVPEDFLLEDGGERLAIHHAAGECSDLNLVKKCLAMGFEDQVLARDRSGCIPLHHACKHGNTAIVKTLLSIRGEEQVMQQNVNNELPLHLACESGFVAAVRLLLKHKPLQQVLFRDPSKKIALHLATSFKSPGHQQCVQALLRHKPFKQIFQRSEDCRRLSRQTPLHRACQSGAEQSVKALLKFAPLQQVFLEDGRGMMPLNLACQANATGAVKLLLEHDPLRQIQQAYYEKYSDLPLHRACSNCNLEMVRLLLSHDPEQILRNSGAGAAFPIHYAIERGSVEIVQELLRYQPEAQLGYERYHRSHDLSPLQLCLLGNDEDVVVQLLEVLMEHCPERQIEHDVIDISTLLGKKERVFEFFVSLFARGILSEDMVYCVASERGWEELIRRVGARRRIKSAKSAYC